MLDGKVITPVVTIVFNFTAPSGDSPSLLSLEEVSTMYHEFGHALDALCNMNTYNQTYVAWDFVELPAQLMEHWSTEPELLNIYARHYQTGESIPASLIEKIKNSGYFNQGFDNVEVLAASLLDMAYYTLEAPVSVDIQSFEKEYFKNQFKGKSFEGIQVLAVTKDPLPEDYRRFLETQKWQSRKISQADASVLGEKYRRADIHAISGATISSTCVTRGVKQLVKHFAYRIALLDRAIQENRIPAAF